MCPRIPIWSMQAHRDTLSEMCTRHDRLSLGLRLHSIKRFTQHTHDGVSINLGKLPIADWAFLERCHSRNVIVKRSLD